MGLPLSSLSAFLISTEAGGVFMMNVKLLSAYAVITTGSIRPGSTFCVWALNALQNSMMLRPRWPSAGPMGGEGFALPAGTCSLMRPTIFFAMVLLLRVQADAACCGALPVQIRREAPGRALPSPQAFSTCPKSSSTGVERPKIGTETRILLFS